jgi:hypothetical protein
VSPDVIGKIQSYFIVGEDDEPAVWRGVAADSVVRNESAPAECRR